MGRATDFLKHASRVRAPLILCGFSDKYPCFSQINVTRRSRSVWTLISHRATRCALLIHSLISCPRIEYTPTALFWRIALIIHFAISLLSGTHLHLSQVKHVKVKCLAQEYNVPILREEKHDISLQAKQDSKPHGRQRHLQIASGWFWEIHVYYFYQSKCNVISENLN